jgi:hypothetical protein
MTLFSIDRFLTGGISLYGIAFDPSGQYLYVPGGTTKALSAFCNTNVAKDDVQKPMFKPKLRGLLSQSSSLFQRVNRVCIETLAASQDGVGSRGAQSKMVAHVVTHPHPPSIALDLSRTGPDWKRPANDHHLRNVVMAVRNEEGKLAPKTREEF